MSKADKIKFAQHHWSNMDSVAKACWFNDYSKFLNYMLNTLP